MSKFFAGLGLGLFICFCILVTLLASMQLPRDVSGLVAIPVVAGLFSFAVAFFTWMEGH